ncbi:putative diphthine methyl ester synthase [Cucumispora dikerogammari]|nr:putative diphthine methyl ester synthase [Cucumispora dikerogammari]
MLHIIGVGLKSFLDVQYSKIKVLKKSKYVFLEAYTCIIDIDSQKSLIKLQKLIKKKILPLQRHIIESCSTFLEICKADTISLLVVGTPFFATTHLDLLERCKDLNIDITVSHNCSIQNVIGCVGLYSYNFGRTISLPFFSKGFQPTSIYDYLRNNKKVGLHTLVLLDIQMENELNSYELEKYILNTEAEDYATNKYFLDKKNNKFMRANTAIEQLLTLEKLTGYSLLDEDTKLFVICRFATKTENIIFDSIKNLRMRDFGSPLHSLIIPGKIDEIEKSIIEKLFK